jgi:hypothetical protein
MILKRKITLALLAAITIISLSAFTLVKYSLGISGASGSPADGVNCSNCHNGGLTTPMCTITSSPAFGPGDTYMPNTTYTITITGSGYTKYGFDFEILDSQSPVTSTVHDFGTIDSVPPGEFINPPSASYPYSDVAHTIPRTGAFTVIWTAPASGTGYLYCALLGANGNSSTSGDNVKLMNMTLTQSLNGIEAYSDTNLNLNVFPNPANEKVRVSYNLTERSIVSLKLFNLKGDLVKELLSETQNKGTYNMESQLTGVAKGMYMLRLSMNGKQSVKKLIVNRE